MLLREDENHDKTVMWQKQHTRKVVMVVLSTGLNLVPNFLFTSLQEDRTFAPRRSSNTCLLAIPTGVTSHFSSLFSASASSTWNSLPVHIRQCLWFVIRFWRYINLSVCMYVWLSSSLRRVPQEQTPLSLLWSDIPVNPGVQRQEACPGRVVKHRPPLRHVIRAQLSISFSHSTPASSTPHHPCSSHRLVSS